MTPEQYLEILKAKGLKAAQDAARAEKNQHKPVEPAKDNAWPKDKLIQETAALKAREILRRQIEAEQANAKPAFDRQYGNPMAEIAAPLAAALSNNPIDEERRRQRYEAQARLQQPAIDAKRIVDAEIASRMSAAETVEAVERASKLLEWVELAYPNFEGKYVRSLATEAVKKASIGSISEANQFIEVIKSEIQGIEAARQEADAKLTAPAWDRIKQSQQRVEVLKGFDAQPQVEPQSTPGGEPQPEGRFRTWKMVDGKLTLESEPSVEGESNE